MRSVKAVIFLGGVAAAACVKGTQETYRLTVVARIRRNFSHCNHDRSTCRSMSPELFLFLLEWLAECENIDAAQHNPVHSNLNEMERNETKR